MKKPGRRLRARSTWALILLSALPLACRSVPREGPRLTALDADATRFRLCMPSDEEPLALPSGAPFRAMGWHADQNGGHPWMDVSSMLAGRIADELDIEAASPPPERYHFQARFSVRAEPKRGEPLFIELAITNTSGEVATIERGSESCDPNEQPSHRFRCQAYFEGRPMMRKRRWSQGGSIHAQELAPGETVTHTLCLSRRFYFEAPGEYTVEVSYRLKAWSTNVNFRSDPRGCPVIALEHTEKLEDTLTILLRE